MTTATQHTVTFNYDAAIGSVEITATRLPSGSIRFNSVRRNSDYRPATLTAAEQTDARNVAKWYIQDAE